MQPTAQALRAEVTANAYRALPPGAGFGLGTILHRVPFHRSIRTAVFEPNRRPVWPTAHARPAEVAATASSDPPDAPVGLGSRRHAPPRQRSIRVVGLPARPVWPTAHAL